MVYSKYNLEETMIDLSRLRKKTLPQALTPRSPEDRAKRRLPATASPLVVEGEASQSSPSLDLEIEDDPTNR